MSGLNIDNLKTFIGRGSHKESLHEAIAIAAPNEGPRLLFGSADPGTFLRSVAKPFQALAMLRAGIAESFSLSPEELAVICSSHAGEPIHRDLVRALLSRGGLSESHLDCGVHAPFSRSERVRIIASGELPDVTCSNCSGKHTGMLLACVARGYPVEGYLDPSHPLQRSIRAMVELFTGEVLEPASFGVDGCGAPTFFMPLASIARAFHRLHDDQFLKRCGLEERVERMHDAIDTHPRAFSGEGRLPLRWSRFLTGQFRAKEGAEGVMAVWGPQGALITKSLDGADRGLIHAVPLLLHRMHWIDDDTLERWIEDQPRIVRNVAGRVVGEISVDVPDPSVLEQDYPALERPGKGVSRYTR